MGLLQQIVRTAKSMATGHAVTFREMLKKPMTVYYPEERIEHPVGYRGIPVLKVNEETGLLNCTACGLCARTCPPAIIDVESATDENGRRKQFPAKFDLDLSRCMVCNLCVEACPFDALEMAEDVALSSYTAEELIFNMEELTNLWKTSKSVRIAGGEQI